MSEYDGLLKNIAVNNEQEDIYRLLDVFLEFTEDFIKPHKGKGVPEEDLRQECALVISEELLSGVFLDKKNRRERLLESEEGAVDMIFAEIIHDVSQSCEAALSDLTETEERSKKAGVEILAKVNMINEGAQRFTEEYGIKATPAELSEYLEIDEEIIIEAVELSGYEIKNIDFDTAISSNKK